MESGIELQQWQSSTLCSAQYFGPFLHFKAKRGSVVGNICERGRFPILLPVPKSDSDNEICVSAFLKGLVIRTFRCHSKMSIFILFGTLPVQNGVITGSIAPSAKCRHLSYSEAALRVFHPAGATRARMG